MYKLILFSVLIIICTIRSAIGQNYLIEKEESSFHGSAQLT